LTPRHAEIRRRLLRVHWAVVLERRDLLLDPFVHEPGKQRLDAVEREGDA
jgi:hypothetical protein